MELISPSFHDLFQPTIEIRRYPDSDSYVRIPELSKCKNTSVTVYHRLYPEQDSSLLQTLFILEELKKVHASVTLVAPYLPYARQDKVFLEGEVKSAEMICNLLFDAGCKKLITFDCHFLKKEGLFTYGRLPIQNISMNDTLIAHAKKVFKDESFEIISPDEGAKYMVAESGGQSMKKTRGDYHDEQGGEVVYREVEKLEGKFNFKNKNVLILDDIISTGSTMILALEKVKASGAKSVACAATHGFFLKDSLAKLRTSADFVFVTNSIVSPVSEVSIMDKIKTFE